MRLDTEAGSILSALLPFPAGRWVDVLPWPRGACTEERKELVLRDVSSPPMESEDEAVSRFVFFSGPGVSWVEVLPWSRGPCGEKRKELVRLAVSSAPMESDELEDS